MNAILFIHATAGAAAGRRIDLAGIARRFAEPDEPVAPPARSRVAQIALLALVLLGVMGDLLLVTRSGTIAGCLSASPTSVPPRQAA